MHNNTVNIELEKKIKVQNCACKLFKETYCHFVTFALMVAKTLQFWPL